MRPNPALQRARRKRRAPEPRLVSCHGSSTAVNDQPELWDLVHGTLNPKKSDVSTNACLNRLTNERLAGNVISLNPDTAMVRDERWLTEHLVRLDRKHERMHDFDDERPLVAVEHLGRLILVDGNHRVTRWLASGQAKERQVLIISLRGHVRDS